MPEPSTASATRRTCDLALLIAFGVFIWSAWPALGHAPIGLDDRALLASFQGAKLGRVWGYDHFGHLRPIKNLCFWLVANHPGLVLFVRAFALVAAVACAWLVRSVSLARAGSPLLAAAAGALWLLNPTTAVAVSWLSASNYLFALLGMLLYVFLIERKASLWLAHALLLVAVLSHELAMLTPLWLLVQRTRSSTKPLWIGAASVLAAALVLRLAHTAPQLAYRTELPAWQLMASAAYNLLQNLRLWVWLPGRFGVLLTQTRAPDVMLCIGAWLGVIGALWLLWRERLALVWVLLFLVPVINLIPIGVTPVAVHYLIIPGVGLAWLTAAAFERLPRQAGVLVTLALVIGWQPAFRQTVQAYHDEIALYRASLASYPDNAEARVNLIAAYTSQGEIAQAQDLLQEGLQRTPDHPGLLKHQLLALLQADRNAEAQAWLERHQARVQHDPDLSLRRALLLRKLGRNPEAERAFEHVLSLAADSEIRATAGYQLANLYVQSGRLPEAQALLNKLHREQPNHADIKLALRLINDILQTRTP